MDSMNTIRPRDLAIELHKTPLQIRNFLRKEFTRDEGDKWSPWFLTEEIAAAVRAHFGHSRRV